MDIDILNEAPETKAGIAAGAGGAVAIHDDVMRIFETYKAENDARLAAIAKGRPDVLHEEKMARLDA